MKAQENPQTRDHLSFRARVADDIAKLQKHSPFAVLRYPQQEETLGVRFLNRLFKFPTEYYVKSEEDFSLALRKTVEAGRAVRVHLSLDCGLRKGVLSRQPMQSRDVVTSVSARAKCSDNVSVIYSLAVDTSVRDGSVYKDSELHERSTCVGSLYLLSLSSRILRDFPLIPVECGTSNILSNRAVMRDVLRIAERYGIEVPQGLE